MTGCPARYDEELGYWVVDDPALAREVLLDPATFRPDNAVLAHTPLSVKALRVLSGVGFALPPTLANNAGESHRPIRAAVARFFSPARVAAAERLARDLTAARVAEATKVVERDGQVDLVQAVAAEPPALVVLDMLGLTEVDVPALKAWSLDSSSCSGAGRTRTVNWSWRTVRLSSTPGFDPVRRPPAKLPETTCSGCSWHWGSPTKRCARSATSS